MIRALIILFLLTIPAQAQTVVPCLPKQKVLDFLVKRYAESPTWSGANQDGTKFLVTSSRKGTWTLLRLKDDMACILASGNASKLDRGV